MVGKAEDVDGVDAGGLYITLVAQNSHSEGIDFLKLDKAEGKSLSATSVFTTLDMLFGKVGFLIALLVSGIVEAESLSVCEDLDLLRSVSQLRRQCSEEDPG